MTTPKSIQRLTQGLMVGLAFEFIFGMVANLFFEFPDTTNVQTLRDASLHNVWVATHIFLGLFLVLMGAFVLFRAYQMKNKKFIAMAGLGFISLLVAATGGDRFVNTQQEMWSLIMAIGFILSMAFYGQLMIASTDAAAKPTPQM